VTPVLLRAAAILASLVLVAAGCGGEEPEEDDPKAEYVAETNAICERLSEDSVALVDETLGERNVTPKRLRVVSRESAVIQRQALADLRALPPPQETRNWSSGSGTHSNERSTRSRLCRLTTPVSRAARQT